MLWRLMEEEGHVKNDKNDPAKNWQWKGVQCGAGDRPIRDKKSRTIPPFAPLLEADGSRNSAIRDL
jgi:hypothetical protein